MLSVSLCSLLLFSCTAQSPGHAHGGGACATEWDCSLGGDCISSACVCDAWVTGANCDLLNLAPAKPDAGLQVPGYFSWGGHALSAGDGVYHLFSSFMCRHATLSDWTTKSSIWRSTASTADGPFTLAEMVAQPWSHNAFVSATAGDAAAPPYVLYQIGDAVTDPSEWEPCYNASEAFSAPPRQRKHAAQGAGYSVFVRSATSLAGPWSQNGTGIDFIFPPGGWATSVNGGNPAPFFFENGTVLMYFSANPCPPHWGNISPGNNCIGVAVGTSWRGPFTALPLPVTHPESEDAAVFRTSRGFHLLTNVNNDHARCAEGVPCGGHAWSVDGLTFSNLTIGAFGPVIRFSNGSYWHTAYVERPQVVQARDGTPIAFYVGMGRSSYFDSATFAQLFCVEGQADCGPTTPPPAPPAPVVQYQHGSRCLVTNASTFPCPGGWSSSCPLFLGSCSDPSSRWIERADGSLESQLHAGNCANIDCNSCNAHTVAKAIACESAAPLEWRGSSLAVTSCAEGNMCLDDGSTGAPNPPCKSGEQFLATQVTLASCAIAAAQGWTRIVV